MSNLVGSKEKFQRDMEAGEDFERRFKEAMEVSFGEKYAWIKHENCSGTRWHCKCFDLESLAEGQLTIECKKDWKAQKTKNICLEAYLMNPEICKADYLAHEIAEGHVIWFNMFDLREGLMTFHDNGYLPIQGGDDKKTLMYVIDGKLFLKHVPHKRLNLNEPLSESMWEL